ncbi:adenylate/guanylate cyclase domain-containing protein [Rhodovibrio salinarum]|nr:adenylate/guanylate cyclase domain-containing protein [Rhodovibrio salinarum]
MDKTREASRLVAPPTTGPLHCCPRPNDEASEVPGLLRWLAESAETGTSEEHILAGACERLCAAGVPVDRAFAGIELIHPLLEGQLYLWNSHDHSVSRRDLDRFDDERSEWEVSPLYQLHNTGTTELRRRVGVTYVPGEFPLVDKMVADGIQDYVAFMLRRQGSHVVGEHDMTFLTFATRAPEGFSEHALDRLRASVSAISGAMRLATGPRMIYALMETYLGQNAGRRVLRGGIARGEAEEIRAVIWLSDLHGFTKIADEVDPDAVVPLLNAYAEAQVAAVERYGGEVLKFMGDGVLAIFPIDGSGSGFGDCEKACGAALDAAEDTFVTISELNRSRSARGDVTTTLYLGLHVGQVYYGNIGSPERLDFTVVGPAVNEASRIADMAKAVDKDAVVSSAFVEAAPGTRHRLVSLGRHALRGVYRPQELFTLDPETER